ncbi:GntR family transcriptional regulator [Paenibacillus daejeonensis]|uniref:GntR family transcriptional regulator n=1 Tax=Paenibacillus daejeonensis TaxID=135193 RepID=UPI00036B0FC7|nr:GntR family transcriptional regulator [Paenibacillus daejeonensis]
MTEIPLYQQIVQRLKQQIASGELKSGDQVPTEAVLSEQFGVSRITSKRALTELENEGLIYRVRGKGSFVRERETRAGSRSSSNTDSGASTIGSDLLLLLPFSHNPGLGDYEQGMHHYLDAAGHTLHIQANSPGSQRRLLEQALLRPHQGLIFYPLEGHADLDLLYQYALREIPVVLMDKHLEGLPFPAVVSDNQGGGYEAALHLIRHGHRKIAFLSWAQSATVYTVRERYWGYLKAMHEHQLTGTASVEVSRLSTEQPEHSIQACYMQTIQMLREQGVTAIVASNDLEAIECIRAAQSLGLSVPDDLSIIGFDNIQMAEYITPGLTTVAQDFARIGYLAAELLVRQIRQPHQPQPSAVVPVQLIERGSVKTLQS